MKAVLVVLLALLAAAPAVAHTRNEHGNIFAPVPVGAQVFVGLETVAPGLVPNGLFYYVIEPVSEGEQYVLSADDGQEALVVGTATSCPGPNTFEPTDPDWWLNEFWVYCRHVPDFELWFICGNEAHQADLSGTVPCDGRAVVFLAFGDSGEGFSWSEA